MEEELIELRREKLLNFIQSPEYIAMKKNDIAVLLEVPSEDRPLFYEMIEKLKSEGKLLESKKGKLMAPKMLNMVAGTFLSHSKGFGFVATENIDERDIFVPADNINGAMHRDKVLCRIVQAEAGSRRAEGEIIKILERGSTEVVGTFEKGKGFGFVIPDDKKLAQDIFIASVHTKGAVTGHKVVVKILKFPEGRRNPEGQIVEILGHVNDPGVDILSIVRQYNLPVDFPKEVYEQIESIPTEVEEKELLNREDLRGHVLVTIDGEDAKDLDDAVSLEKLPNGNYSLGVHIADVTHYVPENSPLDKEALLRGTSVYLVDRVIPMLPHKLSNGICSLNPDVDRLALSCIMQIDPKGVVVEHKIVNSVIHTYKRMTYTAVAEILEQCDGEARKEYSDLAGLFEEMQNLRNILLNKRKQRGAINFDLPESKIILDEKGTPIEIRPHERNVATSIIEEFMLVCNETIAEDYFWQETPFLFRNHETPDEEKIKKMEEFIQNFGYRVKGKSDLHPKAVQQILNKAEGSPEEHIVSRMVLRSMKQAKYEAENVGHFGLAAKYYCHFTSPIRRYPDLEIHRIIKENIRGGLNEKRTRGLLKHMPEIARQCSMRERVAEEAERETDNLKKVEFMLDKVGNIYEGIISGVTGWGIYVELPNTIEGMVAVANMDDDYYVFDESHMMFLGERHKKTYRLGDHVFVQVAKANMEMRNIDFLMVDEPIIQS